MRIYTVSWHTSRVGRSKTTVRVDNRDVVKKVLEQRLGFTVIIDTIATTPERRLRAARFRLHEKERLQSLLVNWLLINGGRGLGRG